MKRFLWNLKCALLLRRSTGLRFRYAWQSARSSDDAYNEEMSPREACEVELSYWEE